MPESKHPLRTLRAATPHRTQTAFAAFLGIPATVLQSIESGKARMTPRLASLIREMTGADDVEVLRGADGSAVSLEGRRYTPDTFAAWQESPQQRLEIERRTGAERARAAAWELHAARAAHGGEMPEDWLVPWQTCEMTAATVRDWRRIPAHRQRLTGWSDSLPLPAHAKLTLAVLAAPPWDPASAPPGVAAANADLFPPCYFTVAVGSGGCRMAAQFWHSLCREHGVFPDNGAPRAEHAPTGSWRGFFRARDARCEPHAVFAGLDAAEAGALAPLFASGGILSGGTADTLAEGVLRFMQEHSEDAGSPAGIILFASLEGGTASALGSELLERLRAQFPAMPILVIGVLPLSGVSSVVTAPWHLALALQAIRRHASAAVIFSNDQLLSQAVRDWHLTSPGYHEANLLIAECLSALTAPLRFGGSDSQPVDLRALLESFTGAETSGPAMITGRTWPLDAFVDRRQKETTLPRLTERLIRTAGTMHMTDAQAIAAFLRVRLHPGDEWMQDDAPLAISVTGRTGIGLHESATVFAASPVIRRTLITLEKQARELLKLKSAASLCAQLRVSEEELRDAIDSMTL